MPDPENAAATIVEPKVGAAQVDDSAATTVKTDTSPEPIEAETPVAGEPGQTAQAEGDPSTEVVEPVAGEEPEAELDDKRKARTARRIEKLLDEKKQLEEVVGQLKTQLTQPAQPTIAPAAQPNPENSPEHWAKLFNQEKGKGDYERDQGKLDTYFARYESAKESQLIDKATARIRQEQQVQQLQSAYASELGELNAVQPFLKRTQTGLMLDTQSPVWTVAKQLASAHGAVLPDSPLPAPQSLYWIARAQNSLLAQGGAKVAAQAHRQKIENGKMVARTGLEAPRRSPVAGATPVAKEMTQLATYCVQHPSDKAAQEKLLTLRLTHGGLIRKASSR